ncbi:haloalkanoic acid dehalogenase [Dacryopinax primogenitus]|uniref:Haloalkanoic acid dehalogenase n=1 Tax=Dacryopinax primogenitus (strain DJM 731) TaxID=1858805 RepID=M5GC71_DACPD|nr:haloalkanoic acid dehalogenase [Dacryopinax primogenitus]EJU06095.1 haloalkanoic acid dehalogenase [Dacryopinax primogenitus]
MSQKETPTTKKLTDFKLLCFDCYGTLIDWETGIYNALEPLLQRTPESRAWSKKQALETFCLVEAAIQEKDPALRYTDVLAETYKELAKDNFGYHPSQNEADIFAASTARWYPLPDTVDALAELSKHYKLLVLSNTDRVIFDQSRRLLEHGFTFDEALLAEDLGHYKPDLRNFEDMLKVAKNKFGIEKDEVLVTAQSLFHDHVPANKLGLASAWIARRDAFIGHAGPEAKYDWKFDSMGDMAATVKAGASQ